MKVGQNTVTTCPGFGITPKQHSPKQRGLWSPLSQELDTARLHPSAACLRSPWSDFRLYTYPAVLSPYHLEGVSSVGGSDLAILSRTRMGLSSWCGGSICAISISVMPKDQMSAL